MTYPLYLMTLSSIPSFPCGPIPRITEGLRFGGDPCHLTHAGLRRPTHGCESVRRFPSPCLKFGALCRVPLYAGYVGMVSARLEQRAASPYSEVIWPSYRVLFGPSSAWFNWFTITARHAWLHSLLPTSPRESRFSFAYSHPYARNVMTWRQSCTWKPRCTRSTNSTN